MSRILVCGLCPLPFENTLKSYGPGIRTWQFAWSLAQHGHQVSLLAMIIPGVYDDGEAVPAERCDGVDIRRVSGEEFMEPSSIAAVIEEVRPDAVVGATIYGSFTLARAGSQVPFWADQFGHVMAEAQAKAALERENWPLAHWWKMVDPVMRSADRISAVSEPQRYAAIGELGALGRLNWQTCGYEFISVIPCALVLADSGGSGSSENVMRGRLVAAADFVVLWSGGYNVWSDVDTLFAGLCGAMQGDPAIHFVSTGGAIAGHDSQTYARFEELIEASSFSNRCHLQGWLRAGQVPRYTAEADLGVLTERPMYEGALGSKNRVIQWMGAGLPVIYNRVGDLGDLLATRKLGLTFPPRDASALADRLLWAARHRDELRKMAADARKVATEEFSFTATTRSLCTWADTPAFAPDAEVRGAVRGPLDHGGASDKLALEAQRISAVRGSRLLRRLWRRLRPKPREL